MPGYDTNISEEEPTSPHNPGHAPGNVDKKPPGQWKAEAIL